MKLVLIQNNKTIFMSPIPNCINGNKFFYKIYFVSITIIFLINIPTFSFSQIAGVITPTGGFHIDGGLRAGTPSPTVGDWFQPVGGAVTPGYVFNIVAANTVTPIDPGTTNIRTDLYNSSSDNIFAEGSKFNFYISALDWTTNTAPNKNDINNGLYHIGRDAQNNQWVFMAGDRLSINGTSYIDFEFLQGTVTKIGTNSGTFTSTIAPGKNGGGGRTENDMVVSMEYTNGGSKPIVYIYQWKLPSGSTTWQWVLLTSTTVPNLASLAFAETNRFGDETNVPYLAFGTNTYPQYAFVEAAVNFTGLLNQIGLSCAGLAVKTLWIKTKAAATSTAALKDFMDPIPVNLNFGASSITQIGPFCVNDNTGYQLTAEPAGGTFTDTYVTQGGVFTPSTAGVGTFTITYNYSGCTATTTIVVNPVQTANAGTNPSAQCYNGSGNVFNLNGTVQNGTSTWTVYSNPNNLGVSFYNANAATTSVTVTAPTNAGGVITFLLTSYSNSNPSCGTATSTVVCTINAQAGAPAVTYAPPPCDASTFTVTVNSPVNGGVYTIKDKNNANISGVKVGNTTLAGGVYTATSGSDFSFNSIPAGSGYRITLTQSGCTSVAAACGSPTISLEKAQTTEDQIITQYINIPDDLTVNAHPNPYTSRIKFVVSSPEVGNGSLELYNMLGQKVRTVYQGRINLGLQVYEVSIPLTQRMSLIYVMKLNGRQVTGKLLNSRE
jgi:hypothetical protein